MATQATESPELHCDLHGNYGSEDTILSKVDSAPAPTPPTQPLTPNPIAEQLKRECQTLPAIDCTKKVTAALKSDENNAQLGAYVKDNYEQLLHPVEEKIKSLRTERSRLKEDYLEFGMDFLKGFCVDLDERVQDTAFCIDGVIRLTRSYKPEVAKQALDYITTHKDWVKSTLDKRIQDLFNARKTLERCRPGTRPPNQCETTNLTNGIYEPFTDCVNVEFDSKPNQPICQYTSQCEDQIKISYGGAFVTLSKNDRRPCFVLNTYDDNGQKRSGFAGATCNLANNYGSGEAIISHANPAPPATKTVTEALKELQQLPAEHTSLLSTVERAYMAAKALVETGFDPSICKFIERQREDLERSVNRRHTLLSGFREANNVMLSPSSTQLDKCLSSTFTPLQDCITPVFDCDSLGDNSCEYLNQCPEELVLTRNWQSKNIKSGERHHTEY